MRTILITGASSGIGAALAREYAAPDVRLVLSGRDEGRLDAVAIACRDAGADVETAVLDVTDTSAMRAWIEAVDERGAIDIAIANAGISGGGGEEADRRIFDINLGGVLNTVHPVLDRMTARKAGTLALVSSIAGNRGFPSAPAYSASKAAVLAYGEALRGRLRGSGVTVCVICPGFVRSRITDKNDFRMPFFMEADRAARIIRRGLSAKQAKISFPWPMRFVGWISRALPSGLGTRLMSGLPEKRPD
ncbi:SDR family NAD(P)-dependent oxidoreductase [Pacificispira sp.]|uniref:SDR family NAD(P)-dependent oxidoreductase n=1 Tax=Pacificispira sp. TaxID=2888761 RepID=UPI003B528DAC